jgi:hypothetical protein
MPKASRRRIPDEQIAHLRSSHQAQLDALAERAWFADQLWAVEAKRADKLAELDAEVAGARHDLLVADMRLADLIGVEAAAEVTGTAVGELRRAVKGSAR